MLSRYIEYIKGHSFIAMLLAFQGSSTCHVPGQRCLAGCSKSNRLNRREFGQKSLNRRFFYFVKISWTKIVRNLGPIQYIDTEWALRTTFWHSDSPDILITESPAALGLLCGQEGESPILGGWDLPTCIFRPPRCTILSEMQLHTCRI